MATRSYQDREKRVSEITRIINLAWRKVAGEYKTVNMNDLTGWVEARYDCNDWCLFWRFVTGVYLIEFWKTCPPYQAVKLSDKPIQPVLDCTETWDIPSIYYKK